MAEKEDRKLFRVARLWNKTDQMIMMMMAIRTVQNFGTLLHVVVAESHEVTN